MCSITVDESSPQCRRGGGYGRVHIPVIHSLFLQVLAQGNIIGEEANTWSFRKTLHIPSVECEECTALAGWGSETSALKGQPT